jgi:hypothetical protein
MTAFTLVLKDLTLRFIARRLKRPSSRCLRTTHSRRDSFTLAGLRASKRSLRDWEAWTIRLTHRSQSLWRIWSISTSLIESRLISMMTKAGNLLLSLGRSMEEIWIDMKEPRRFLKSPCCRGRLSLKILLHIERIQLGFKYIKHYLLHFYVYIEIRIEGSVLLPYVLHSLNARDLY